MKNNTDQTFQRILQEYISLLVEAEDSGGDYGNYYDYGMGGGYSSVGTNQLYQTFIDPFVNVARTAAYGIEKLSTQTATILKGIVGGLPTLFMPFLEFDFKKFREIEANRVKDVKKKYEKVLQTNIEALTSGDALGVGFLLAPSLFLGANLGIKAPAKVLHALEIMFGGIQGFEQARRSVQSSTTFGNSNKPPSSSQQHEAVLNGDLTQGEGEVAALLKNKAFLDQVEQTPMATAMHKDAVNILVGHVQKFMELNTIQELQAAAPDMVARIQQNLQGKVPQQELGGALGALVPQVKKLYKDFWVKKLQDLATQYPQAAAEIQAGISQVEALK